MNCRLKSNSKIVKLTAKENYFYPEEKNKN